jgi:hypothetical protein
VVNASYSPESLTKGNAQFVAAMKAKFGKKAQSPAPQPRRGTAHGSSRRRSSDGIDLVSDALHGDGERVL